MTIQVLTVLLLGMLINKYASCFKTWLGSQLNRLAEQQNHKKTKKTALQVDKTLIKSMCENGTALCLILLSTE